MKIKFIIKLTFQILRLQSCIINQNWIVEIYKFEENILFKRHPKYQGKDISKV